MKLYPPYICSIYFKPHIMKELPENQTLSKQINETLKDRVISEVFNATKFHKNTFYFGDPLTYSELLIGRRINSSMSFGMYVDIILDKETKISFGDGTNLKYGTISNKMPNNYQLLLALDNNTYLTFTVGMFGVIAAYTGIYNDIYYKKNLDNLSPLSDDFNEQYFEKLCVGVKPKSSVKVLLATEQRIPGLGNGVLQDILFNAKINPKREINSLTDIDKSALLQSIKMTLKNMILQGGRDTEMDIFGNHGNYKTILSKNTLSKPCPQCGNPIIKETSSGGVVYYCPYCQK